MPELIYTQEEVDTLIAEVVETFSTHTHEPVEPPIEPPVEPPVDPPDLPELPEIPAGKDIDAEDLEDELRDGPEGLILRVRPGVIPIGARNAAKDGQEVWGLAGLDLGAMPVLDGGGASIRGLEGNSEGSPTHDVVWAYVELTDFDPADESWIELEGNQSDKRRKPTIRLKTFRDSRFIGLWVHDTGRGIDGGVQNLIDGCLFDHCHHMWLHASNPNGDQGFTVKRTEARYTNVRRSDGLAYFKKGWEVGVKVVNFPNVTVEDLWTHDNNGAGFWADGVGNSNHVYRRILAENNRDQGIHFEIAEAGPGTIFEDCITRNHGGAADLYISNSRGESAAKPILVKGGEYGPHKDVGTRAAAAIKNNPNRSPLADFIRFEDVTFDVRPGKEAIQVFGGGPTPTSIVAINCVDQDGNAVTVSGL